MIKKLREKINIFVAKSPKKAVLIGIILFNVVFILIAAAIISALSQHISGLRECSFWESVYYTIAMIFDAGCIDNVITDVGLAGAFAAIVCMGVILIGMIFFTGAVIGYVTNIISDFIDSKQHGKNKLCLSGHTVIVNWNLRGNEIIKEFLYANRAMDIVVFVPDQRDEISKEINDCLNTLILKENQQVREDAEKMSFFEKRIYLKRNLLKNRMTIIVREGDVASVTDMNNICISQAENVIILDNNYALNHGNGDMQTIKTVIQVSELSKSNKTQAILVEVDDERTEELVNKIMEFNIEEGNDHIIPISYDKLHGNTDCQIAIMPELNSVFNLLFSNKGSRFISKHISQELSGNNENEFVETHLKNNCHSIPLAVMDTAEGKKAFFLASTKSDLDECCKQSEMDSVATVKKNPDFKKRNIIILSQNNSSSSFMEGFDIFKKERLQKNNADLLSLVTIDDSELLKKKLQESASDANVQTTILILSDANAEDEEIDANILTALIDIKGQIHQIEKNNPNFRRSNLTIIATILDPKNEDIVKNYGADQVIISGRFISHIASQVCLRETNPELFADILTCDSNGHKIIIVSVEDFLEVIPEKCTAYDLIRMIYAGCSEKFKAVLLGYISEEKDCVLFSGDQRTIEVELKAQDKLILFY